MRRIGLLLACMMVVGRWLPAQECDTKAPVWVTPGETPTFLALMVGQEDRLAPAVWAQLAAPMPPETDGSNGPKALYLMHAGKMEEAQGLLAPTVAAIVAGQARLGTTPDSTITPDQRSALEFAGLAAIMVQKPQEAILPLRLAMQFPGGDRHLCRLRTERLLASYLASYGTQAPLFPHFNGGFFNYLQDSLGWKAGATDPQGFVTALNVVAECYRIDRAHGPLYLELLGDLLSHEPDAFNAHYLSAIAYLRAALLLGGDGQAVLERKAIYALEAPHQNEERFNQYRFTQLKKALQEDVDSAEAVQRAHETQDVAAGKEVMKRFANMTGEMIATGFSETSPGRLPAMLARSKSQIAAHDAEVKRYAGDVDLKAEVKKDNRFNTFALFLIGSIIAAAIVIWRKLLVASRSRASE